MTRRTTLAGLASLPLASSALAGVPAGYVVPAEEAPHQATIMMWPDHRSVYDDPVFLRMTQATILNIANTIADLEPVFLCAHSDHHAALRSRLSGNVTLWDIPTEDLWARDAGPLFTQNRAGDLAVSRLQFNGWGDKQIHTNDSQVARRVADRLGVPLFDTGLTGEAGGVEQDGHGSLMAHRSSWINPNRNRGREAEITSRLLAAYGADRMVWSDGVMGEDITDYHIDSLARFTGPERVLINLPNRFDPEDPFAQAAGDSFDILSETLDVHMIREPVKRRVRDPEFVASYANYYVCNGAVILAQFGDPKADKIAADTLASHYPGRDIIALNVDPLGELGGGIHCATQQVPA